MVTRIRPLETRRVVGIRLHDPVPAHLASILTVPALELVAQLTRTYAMRLKALVAARRGRQAIVDHVRLPGVLPETRGVRDGEWTVTPGAGPSPRGLGRASGPVPLGGGLTMRGGVVVVDLGARDAGPGVDALDKQVVLREAITGTLRCPRLADGAVCSVVDRDVTLVVRPRPLPDLETAIRIDRETVPACLVDVGLFLFHNARMLHALGRPVCLVPGGLEHFTEARFWSDVFAQAESLLGLPAGTVRVPLPIETLPAAFQTHELVHELRLHVCGLVTDEARYQQSCVRVLHARCPGQVPAWTGGGAPPAHIVAYRQVVQHTGAVRGVPVSGGSASVARGAQKAPDVRSLLPVPGGPRRAGRTARGSH